MQRSSGILLPVSALPSPYGIGTLGKEARKFVDFLAAAKQTYWQVLPLGPTSYGDSPYQCFSSFAGNPYYVDLEELIALGLLKKEEVEAVDWGWDRRYVDYEKVYFGRRRILRQAFARFKDGAALARFVQNNPRIEEYALFMAIKDQFGGRPWTRWPQEGLRKRKQSTLELYGAILKEEVDFYCFVQMFFFRQWRSIREYAAEKGVMIIGDLPIYVAADSADVWANPALFDLDEEHLPREVAGVPPDYFSPTGQLWGNPLYDWEAHKQEGYAWWKERLRAAYRLFDVVRIDHFRGFADYWCVPYGAATAQNGRWKKGPGMDFFRAAKEDVPGAELIAEDLGFLSEAAAKLREEAGLPGMRVLQFAFDGGPENAYLPHHYTKECVCYTGTHDNDTLVGWLEGLEGEKRSFVRRYCGLNHEEGYHWGCIRAGSASVAGLFVLQMQDILGHGSFARTNVPGTLGMNWRWRMEPMEALEWMAARLADVTELYGRAPEWTPAAAEGVGAALPAGAAALTAKEEAPGGQNAESAPAARAANA